MRLSTIPNDPGYESWVGRDRVFDVFLDGEKIIDVVTTDTDIGLIVRHKRDEDGQLVIDRQREEVVTETLHGKVEVVERTR